MVTNSLDPQNSDQLQSYRILWSLHTIEYCLDQCTFFSVNYDCIVSKVCSAFCKQCAIHKTWKLLEYFRLLAKSLTLFSEGPLSNQQLLELLKVTIKAQFTFDNLFRQFIFLILLIYQFYVFHSPPIPLTVQVTKQTAMHSD